MANDADRSLVLELQLRNSEAWARAYDNHASDVFAFIVHLLHADRAAAEEIHQNTWLAALSGIAGLDPERGELRGWFFGIARRQVALHFRRLGQSRLEASDDNARTALDDDSLLPLDVIGVMERADAVPRGAGRTGRRNARRSAGQICRWPQRRRVGAPFRPDAESDRVAARVPRTDAQLLGWYFDTENATKDVKP